MPPDLGTDSSTEDDILSKLCNDFPDVDSALILALLSELDDYSSRALDMLRVDLSALALQAKCDLVVARGLQGEDEDPTSSLLSDLWFREELATISTTASSVSPFSPPLEFLLTAFPDLPLGTIQRSLDEKIRAGAGAEPDMEGLVAELLSWELLQELEERGDEEEQQVEQDWTTVQKQRSKKKGKNKASATTTKITLGDVRQQSTRPKPKVDTSTHAVMDNPWASFASLATRLSDLLPPLQPSHFLSLFHNPKYKTLSHAVDAELLRLAKPINSGSLETLKEVIGCHDPHDIHTASMCLAAVPDNPETALDLYLLVKDLNRGSHKPTHDTPITPSISTTIVTVLPHTPSSPATPVSPSFPPPTPSSPRHAWTEVVPRSARRRNRSEEVDPLAQFIPAYRNMPAGWRQQSGRSSDEPDDAEGMTAEECRDWADYYRAKRDVALKEASKHYKSGASRAGDVAFFYAEESRKLEDKSQRWAMKAAKALVKSRQRITNTQHTVDLHGLNVREALHVSQEAVNHWWNSEGGGSTTRKPLSIITGKGNHSKHKVSVIAPAVQKALEAQGWNMSKRPGALIIYGLKGTSSA